MSTNRDPMHVGMDKIVELCSSSDKYIYQYRDENTGFKMLDAGTIRFSPLESFNDPTEAIRFEEISLDGESQHAKAWDLLFKIKTMHQRFRVACFSQDRSLAQPIQTSNFFEITDHYNRGYLLQRMWAQYADNHKGICLAFNKNKLDEMFHEQIEDDDTLLSGAVEYCPTNIPLIRAHTDASPTLLGDTVNSNLKNHFLRFSNWFFFNKQSDWSNENEFRWVYSGEKCVGKPLDLIFGNALEAIIVGHKFPIEHYKQVNIYSKKFRVPCLRVHMSHSFPIIKPANMPAS